MTARTSIAYKLNTHLIGLLLIIRIKTKILYLQPVYWYLYASRNIGATKTWFIPNPKD